jgi:cellulose synthase/poly-beta-1,6-N-acetylglucosamine synthase-like glycosyltransferase
MLVDSVLFFALTATLATVVMIALRLVRAPIGLGLTLSIAAVLLGGAATFLLTRDAIMVEVLVAVSVPTAFATRLWQRRWSFIASQVFALMCLACIAYFAYATYLTIYLLLAYNAIWFLSSLVLLVLEAAALLLALTYAFEMLDVLGRRDEPTTIPALDHIPRVVVQVPSYNEPLQVLQPTLEALAALDYPNFMVQVVDNNTADPAVWRPLEALCQKLGPNFRFIHLEDWPGFKAGALNEATRRLDSDVEIIAIVDADYVVEPTFLKETIPFFEDTNVAFVQTPQNYRDWEDDRYLRGLYYSYRYFFDITMPARAHRDAIIFCGTMGLLRRAHLVEAGGWSEKCITEDAEASLRILGHGHGHSGVYVPKAQGAGLMPLDFDGLKKQRYRWSLGGVQILRMHWRELLPGFRHHLTLTRAQRIHYLLGSLQWFGDLLAAAFTFLLVLTAVGIAISHRLPVRQLSGALILVPMFFLFSGLLRATWAIKAVEGCSWGDAIRALRVWFALSWSVAMACVSGLVRERATFIRTPKHKEGRATILTALASSKVESALGLAAVIAAVAMLVVAQSIPFLILGMMLFFEAGLYFSAPWAAAAAEGIALTPFRQIYKRSAQNTGDRPFFANRAAAVPTGAAIGVGAVLAAGLLVASPSPGTTLPDGPSFPGGSQARDPGIIQQILGASTSPTPAPSANASPPASTASPSSPSTTPSAQTSPGRSPSPRASAPVSSPTPSP